ncbi:YggT family protein [Avibacterium sp. 20-129]|uniref:YggT family protein n=1 Tax=Avibacterium sp. 20-129 TaxID=2911525 RepID=UPI0022481D28|nr:YggT family protein [Avibacterium sp. 20-129]MCW9699144.1 YggT family protein [Avibacterium sp. 20-129]
MGLNSLQFLVYTLINVFSFVLILRTWFQYSRVDFYNPFSQTLVKFTQPVVAPLQKFLPTVKGLNTAALVLCIILGTIKYPLIDLLGSAELAASPQAYLFIGLLHTLRTLGETVIYVLFIQAILSWFNRGQNPLQYTLYQLTEPLLNPIRRILPNTGMIDFSPMLLAFLLFYANRVMYDIAPILWQLA